MHVSEENEPDLHLNKRRRLLVFRRTFDKRVEYYMLYDQNDDIQKFDLNIDETIGVVHSSYSKTYQGYTKNDHVFVDEFGRV